MEKSIGDKIEKSLARTDVFIGKYSASKYLGQPISDIKAEERRIDNIIADRQAKIDSFVNETVDSYKKMVIKNCHWTEERAEEYARNLLETIYRDQELRMIKRESSIKSMLRWMRSS